MSLLLVAQYFYRLKTEKNNGKGELALSDHTKVTYYPIDETAARRAKEMNSFWNYVPGSATEEYRRNVDQAVQVADEQKARTDPMYHEKIDSLLDTYARKLAENRNQSFAIEARVPSIMISGAGNFPVQKKEKQNQARDRNMQEWREIQGLLDKIKGTGMGGIASDDPNALKKLEAKLEQLEKDQTYMKQVNAYYRKHQTLENCPQLSEQEIQRIQDRMTLNTRTASSPFSSYTLSNNNAERKRVKTRIEKLRQVKELETIGWEFEGGRVVGNQDACRLQIFFDEKPSEEWRSALKGRGFRWAPSVGAWQRLLSGNAIAAADRLPFLYPKTGEKPSELSGLWKPNKQKQER